MIKRTLFFSNTVCLSLKNKQLVIYNPQTKETSTAPVEDLGFVILENTQISITIPLINALTENNVSVVFCNDKHLPVSMLLPLDYNSTQTQTFSNQINATMPTKKQCWKQIIESKIANQAKVLEKYNCNSEQLQLSSKQVKSGDSTNREAYAAKIYWNSLMGTTWIRDQYGCYPNNYLNYGYAILRAAMARSLIGSGLLPALGIHHHNKYNAYCLADDLMEPYRPFVDDEVLTFTKANPDNEELPKDFKIKALQLLTRDVKIGKLTRPLMIALTMTSSSLTKLLSGDAKELSLPEFM